MHFVVRRVAIPAGLVVAAVLLSFPRQVDRARRGVATVPVVVASKDLPEGEVVDRKALVVAQWPAGTQPVGAYASIDSVVGRVTWVPLYKGQVLLRERLVPQGTAAGPGVNITPGKRAYAIRVNDVAVLTSMIRPNNRVDIMVVVDDRQAKQKVARLFMENMRVLAIGPAPGRARDGRPISGAVATIEVTPDEAEQLAIAAAEGVLQLVLRGYGDRDSAR